MGAAEQVVVGNDELSMQNDWRWKLTSWSGG
jgi:hypothetical protein